MYGFDLDCENASSSTLSSGLHGKQNLKFNIHIYAILYVRNNKTCKTHNTTKLTTYWKNSNMVLTYEHEDYIHQISDNNVEHLRVFYCGESSGILCLQIQSLKNSIYEETNIDITICFGKIDSKEAAHQRKKLKSRIDSFYSKKIHNPPEKHYSKETDNNNDCEELFESTCYHQYFLDNKANRGIIKIIKNNKENILYIISLPKHRRHQNRRYISIKLKLPLNINITPFKLELGELKDIGDMGDHGKYHYCNIGYQDIWWSILFKIKSQTRQGFCKVLKEQIPDLVEEESKQDPEISQNDQKHRKNLLSKNNNLDENKKFSNEKYLEKNNMQNNNSDFKDMLYRWKLEDYLNNFKEVGFTNVDEWKYLDLKILTQKLKMKAGHAKKFMRKVEGLLDEKSIS